MAVRVEEFARLVFWHGKRVKIFGVSGIRSTLLFLIGFVAGLASTLFRADKGCSYASLVQIENVYVFIIG